MQFAHFSLVEWEGLKRIGIEVKLSQYGLPIASDEWAGGVPIVLCVRCVVRGRCVCVCVCEGGTFLCVHLLIKQNQCLIL